MEKRRWLKEWLFLKVLRLLSPDQRRAVERRMDSVQRAPSPALAVTPRPPSGRLWVIPEKECAWVVSAARVQLYCRNAYIRRQVLTMREEED